FCKGLNEREGEKYRVPTEAEWEYACRAASTMRWCFGENASLLTSYAWNSFNSSDKMHPVGQKTANGFGLFDNYGNVWEWCSDWYGSDYYLSSPERDPTGPSAGDQCVLHGGAFINTGFSLRSASRFSRGPLHCSAYIGFRVARTMRAAPVSSRGKDGDPSPVSRIQSQ
ncbi:MAG: SUMF1/EgtB/PvdO family nonheme iron enzyme, partial [Planctomycetes bacterium]|nr:SUMF1/EgtB/PvdO family nonheme iron enzyme [Planctomycetota bacterium]